VTRRVDQELGSNRLLAREIATRVNLDGPPDKIPDRRTGKQATVAVDPFRARKHLNN
jgi:hypothetical protein